MTDFVFELRDITDEEVYFTLGLFHSIEEAETTIASVEDINSPISWYQDGGDKESLILIKIPFGMGNEYTNHQEVLKISREQYFNEQLESYEWRRI